VDTHTQRESKKERKKERERERPIHLKQKVVRCIMFWSVIGADPTGMPYVEFINETWNTTATTAVQSKSVWGVGWGVQKSQDERLS
jgi:hypothetical protein